MSNFLDLKGFQQKELSNILALARDLKQNRGKKPLLDKKMAMIFEKPSTRTRVSFEVGMLELGGNAIYLDKNNIQLGRGETIADTARVLSRYVDIIMLRCYQHEHLLELAQYSSVPVINGLTDYSHPCQVMADILTFEEHLGDIKNAKIAWIGDSNNMLRSWIDAAEILGFELNIAIPASVENIPSNTANVVYHHNPKSAAKGANAINSDTWFSMGTEESEEKRSIFNGFQIDDEVMSIAASNAVFMHCLPAHRGEEVTDAVIDGKQSVVFDQAENRLHIQKAIICWCLNAC